jgi:hypothetical protein
MKRARLATFGFVILTILVTVVVSCNDSTANEESRHTTNPTASAKRHCVDATRKKWDAQDGVISAGPFRQNKGHWVSGTKFWVATSVSQKKTAAKISAERVGATGKVTERRGKSTIAKPVPPSGKRSSSTPSSGLFFPGAIRLPKHGMWKINVSIGKDSGCFLVDNS